MHVAFINLGLQQFLLGFCCRLLHPVLLQYQWLRQRTDYQLCRRPIFHSCIFFGFLVFHSTLFFCRLQPADYNLFCFGFSTNCKSYGDSPLTALPFQQPYVVGPGYSPVPFKVVSQITVGKFVNLEDLLAENITMPEQEPQLWFNGQLVLSHMPKKTEAPDYGHRVVDGSLFHFLSHSLLVFPGSMERSDKLQAFNSPNLSSV